MGIDKSLSDDYPSVIIRGQKYHYGRDPEYGQFLVENARYAKDYWRFDAKEDLQAFLINLPESAENRIRIAAAYPDWEQATPEQRDAYLAEDRASQRAIAGEKLKNGAAASFSMDLDGKEGPHAPQKVPPNPLEKPMARVQRQLHDHQSFRTIDFSEAGRLRMIEGEIDWSGVGAADKEAVLADEIDFKRITPEQFKFVYDSIASDKVEPADSTVARALFDKSRAEIETPPIRDTTRSLIKAVMLDVWPSIATVVDFGINTQEHYEALYYPLRHGDFTPEQVDAALGKGGQLTELVNAAPHNPHKGIVFRTGWDGLVLEPEDCHIDGEPACKPTLSAIADSRAEPARPAPGKEKDDGFEL